jgi:probable HAF family extracellular repeat protein
LVVGYASTASEDWHVAYWTPAGAVVDLGGTSQSSAYAVNDTGQIVGSIVRPGDSAMHAFSWTQAGGLVDLGTFGGSVNIAEAVSGSGQVVGFGNTAGDLTSNAFSWTAAGGLINLGASSRSGSYAGAVNNAGEVIGWTQTPHGDLHAALWATHLPSTADDCKNNNWQSSGAFKNQGDCVSYVAAQS